MKQHKGLWITLAIIFVVWIFFIAVPLTFHPPKDLRVVIEHTYGVFIVPPCFDKVDTTNNLSETTLGRALERGYEADPECSAAFMKPAKQTLWHKLLEKIGLIPSPWDWK